MNLTAHELALVCASTEADALRFVDYINPTTSRASINTLDRAAMFFGQIAHESMRLSKTEENLNYSAERLCVVWPTRFRTLAAAKPYARNPRALANNVYGGRMGNVAPDDGYKYRGRGLKQLTGRDNYARMTNQLGVNYLDNPDAVALPQGAVYTAVQFWVNAKGNTFADKGDYRGLTLAINGGLTGYEDGNSTGLDDRVELYQHARQQLLALGLGVLGDPTN